MRALKAVAAIGILAMVGLGPLWAQGAAAGGFSRFHIRAGASPLFLAITPSLSSELNQWGFGDDFSGVFLFWPSTIAYPMASNPTPIDIELAYSVHPAFTVGLSVCGLGRTEGTGRDGNSSNTGSIFITGVLVGTSASGRAYFVNATYGPAPKPGSRFGGRAGLGLGIGDLEAVFETELENREMAGHPFCAQVFAGIDYWVLPFLTLGATVHYRFIPAFPAFEIEASIGDTYLISSSSFGLGGVAAGIGLGLHF